MRTEWETERQNHKYDRHKSQPNCAFVPGGKFAWNKCTLRVFWVALSSTRNELQQKLHFKQAMF
jgi:hypothetical protein